MDRTSEDKLKERQFEVMRTRLLLRMLDEVPNTEAHVAVIMQAHVAATLAWHTSFPLLVFPCLFAERAAAALEQTRRQARAYWHPAYRTPSPEGQERAPDPVGTSAEVCLCPS